MGNGRRSSLEAIKKLTEVGIALSSERDNARLMEMILSSARYITNADGGTLYLSKDNALGFEIMINESLNIHLGGTSDVPIDLPPIPLSAGDGAPSNRTVAAHAVITGKTVNLPDAYEAKAFDFRGTRDFDERTGYRSMSFLTVPMRNHVDEVIGVLQLINAKDADANVVAFDETDQQLVECLASQAAIGLSNKRLIDDQQHLFESFVELLAVAIDDKSPYTGGHCRRVPELTMLLADAAAAVDAGPLKDFSMSESDRYELQIAGWLHDCGKVTTPDWVMDKATKLHTLFDRIHLIHTRFEVLKREAKIELLKAKLSHSSAEVVAKAELAYHEKIEQIEDDKAFLERSNIGGEFMTDEDQTRVKQIGEGRWRNEYGEDAPMLSDDEIKNLSIQKGTLTDVERHVINHHIVATIAMLEALPYPKHLQRVPEFAGGHHERMDGRGYPRGLKRDEMSVQARVMGIADVFEALTAADRPYKPAMKLSQSLNILGKMKLDNHIDPELFDVFVREKIYLKYAEKFLNPEQIDAVDLNAIPGYQPFSEA